MLFSLEGHYFLDFDPYSLNRNASVVDACFISPNQLAIMIHEYPSFNDRWLLFDTKTKNVVNNNFSPTRQTVIYKKNNEYAKWKKSFIQSVLVKRTYQAAYNTPILFGRYYNYIMLANENKVSLYFAGPKVPLAKQKELFNLDFVFCKS